MGMNALRLLKQIEGIRLKHLAGEHDQRTHAPHKYSTGTPIRHNGVLYESLGSSRDRDEFLSIVKKVTGTSDLTEAMGKGYEFELAGDTWHLVNRSNLYNPKPIQRTSNRPYVVGKELDIEQADAITKDVNALYPNSNDAMLESVIKQQGFDGLPDVVTEDQLMNYVAGGEKELWRGVSAPDYADTFRDGSLYVGRGISGNGTYTDERKDTADAYAGSNGETMHMTLKAGSKVVDYMDLVKRAEVMRRGPYRVAMDNLFEDYGTGKIQKSEFDTKYKALQESNTIYHNKVDKFLGDESRVAALLGYDALTNGSVTVILNRTAVRVAESGKK